MKPIYRMHRVAFLLGVLGLAALAPRGAALPVARLKNVHPTVQVRARKARAFAAARERQPLNLGDFVRTNSRGKAFIVFSNGTRVTMKPSSTIQLVAPQSKSRSLSIRVLGALSEVFVEPKAGTEVVTAAGIAAARGTSFLVSLPEENTTVVTVIQDTVEFYNPQGRVLVNAGQQSTARVGEAPTPPVAVDVTGLTQWTLDVATLPVEFELPFAALQGRAQGDMAPADPQNADLLAAQNLYDRGEYSEAAQRFRQIAQRAPEDAWAQFALGQALRQSGDAAGAIVAYREAQERAPAALLPRIGLALAHLGQGDMTAARQALDAGETTAPAMAQALRSSALGLIALRENQPEDAVAQLLEAIERDPNLAQAHALLALAYLAQNNLEAAQHAAQSAVRLRPNSAQAQSTLALALFFRGQAKAATPPAERAVELNPLSPLALLVYGRAMLAQNKTDEAKQALGQAAALAPDWPLILEDLGSAFLRLDQPRQAEKVLRRALEQNPVSVAARTRLGVALQQQGQTEEAEAMQRAVLQDNPQNPAARANLASLLIEEGRFDEAQQVLGAPDEQDDRPEYGSVYIRLSELMLYRGRLLDAQDYARRAVKLLPASAPAHYQLGRVYLEQGRSTQAEAQFREAATLDRNFPEARYALGFARQQAESGLLATPGLSGGAINLGSPATGLDLQADLQGPGTADRVQAALIDPSVVRVASRSLGDTQVDAVGGSDSTYNLKLSHLHERGDRRGVLGLTGSYETTDGPVANGDRTIQDYSLIFGQKGRNKPNSALLIAEYRSDELGRNVYANESTATPRQKLRTPQLLLGFHLSHGEKAHTRVLLQHSQPTLRSGDLAGVLGNDDLKSWNLELRHDRQLNDRNLLNVGLSIGQRDRDSTSITPFPPPLPLISRVVTDQKIRPLRAYIRDEFRVNDHLALTGEVKVQRLSFDSTSLLQLGALVRPPAIIDVEKTKLLPSFIADYRPNAHTGVRLRARRLMTGIEDFELLEPRDLFLFSLRDLPRPIFFNPNTNRFGSGTSYEVEFHHTFGDSTLLRAGAFQQKLDSSRRSALTVQEETLTDTTLRGVRLGVEGVLSRETTYFLNLGYNHARGRSAVVIPGGAVPPMQDAANVPDLVGSAGLQYLDERGYFVQPTYFYLDNRIRVDRTVAGGAHLLNLRVGKRFGVQSALFVELANILDEEYEVFEARQPGRQLIVGGQHRF